MKYYPVPASGFNGFIVSMCFGLFIGLFLLFFKPYNINLGDFSILQILFFGLITFIAFLFAHNIIPFCFPRLYNEKKWTIYSQILFFVILLLIISTLNGLYINYLNDLAFSWSNYWYIIIRTVGLGIIPIVIYVQFSYNSKYRRMSLQAESINEKLVIDIHEDKPVALQVKTESLNETISIDALTFLYAKSSNNYVEVYQTNHKPQLYRLKLSDFEKQLSSESHLVRCHRSYIVNLNRVSSVSGNAQGLKLSLSDNNDMVPVSRKYVNHIRQLITT